MSFSPGGGGISTASDVALSNPADNQILSYSVATGKWTNTSAVVTTTVKTLDATLALTNAGTVIECNSATGLTITVPTNATVAFPIGTLIELAQVGAGQIIIAGATGVTIRTAGTLLSRTQWSTLGLRKRATNEWVLSGDTAA